MMLQWSMEVYGEYGIRLDVRTFPVFQTILWLPNATVSEIADEVGLTHAAVSITLKDLAKQDYITLAKHSTDKRQTIVALTRKGKQEQQRMESLLHDLERVMTDVFSECAHSPLLALQEFEQAMKRKNFSQRVKDFRKQQLAETITVTRLSRRGSKHRAKQLEAFKQLNYAWIERYFTIEKSDRNVLEKPEQYIVARGGIILCAEQGSAIVGAVALIPTEQGTVELAKMVVAPEVRGKSIGVMLGEAAINQAREMGAERVYLESNTTLEAAINLYYKLGFKRVPHFTSPYERANIAMELWLSEQRKTEHS